MKVPFSEVFEDCTSLGTKIKTDEYRSTGKYAIIDQGQNVIAGYTDRTDGVYYDVPAIIFGDHTRSIKYVDTPFFLGADGVKLLKSKVVDANYKYLYYALQSVRIPNTGYNRHFKWLKESKFEYPDSEIQSHIVAVLDKVTCLIAKHKRQLELLDELVKARFVEMFGDPIANPMGWTVNMLKSITTLITNGTTPKGGSKNYVDQGIVFFRSQNIWRNRIEYDDVAYIDYRTHKKMQKSSVHYNDILITKTGRINTENSSLGRAALYKGTDNAANVNGHVYIVRLDTTVNSVFVLTILIGDAYRDYIRRVCVGGIDKRQINIEQVEEFPIICPPIELQEQFADFVRQTDKSKEQVQKSLEQLETLKKALMQKYFG